MAKALVAALAPWVWLAIVTLPRMGWRWAVLRGAVRTVLAATRTPLRVEGVERVPRSGPCVLVGNHAGWLDAMAVVAAVPGPLCFVAAAEFSRHALTRTFLRRLGTEFVERTDREQAVVETRRLVGRVCGGERLVVFPEGRLSPVPGLRPFHLGAFVVAATVGCPVVPFAVRGTRPMLRPGTRRVRPGEVTVEVADPVTTDRSGWAGALELREAARSVIAARCGEPDLAPPAAG
jgi:1-acyl-sn-glycerol-3-phosphate acyltransferase